MTPLHVAIIWHMHQPYYRQPGSDEALLPWVRLHATKDYLHMAEVVARYPDVHVTFTMVPSLAEQLQDYAAGRLHDRLMTLATQAYFSPDDKRYLLNVCFSIDWDNIIRRHPPYAALLDRRPLALLNPDYFSEQTYRDLIVWFHLAWTDPNLLEDDPLLQALVTKGSDFSLADSAALIQKHREIVGEVIPTYRRLQDAGQIEIITVPYFHPILPLLVDSDSARRPSPALALPDPAFSFGDDAAAQIAAAVEFHTDLIGQVPRGMWPSEGSVSPGVAELIAAGGLRWLATDEAILARSLGIYFERDAGDFVLNPAQLYRPYRLHTAQGEVAIVFRDHSLSDRIGFTYQGLGGEQAAEDMIVRLKHVQHQLRNREQPGLVSIILDGENAWERYEHNGDIFLHALYRRLQNDPDLQAVTVTDHIAAHPPADALPELATGSWIMGDFTTWIGDPEHNEAWRRLGAARAVWELWAQSEPDPDRLAEARNYLFAAEGSDWFWWYSHRNSSDQDALFDQSFVDYLAAAYEMMGQTAPAADLLPIQGLSQRLRPEPVFFTPRLNADANAAGQWSQAGLLRMAASTGMMQRAGGLLQVLRYGNDASQLFLRAELGAPIARHHLELHLRTPGGDYLLSLGRGQTSAFLYRQSNGTSANLGVVPCVLGEGILEIALPLARLDLLPLSADSQLTLWLKLDPRDSSAERLPSAGEHVVQLARKAARD